MDVQVVDESLDHRRIVGDVGEHPQFNLGIVGVHQQTARGRIKEAAELASPLCAHRNILQVRLGRADAAGPCFGLTEDRADPVVGIDLGQQPVDIGGLELGQFAVGEDVVDDRMVFAQPVEGVGVGGKAAFGLFAGGQSEPVKEHLPELLGGVDVEFSAREEVDPSGQLREVGVQLAAVIGQPLLVEREAEGLHRGEHPRERNFDLSEQPLHPLLLQLGGKRRREGGQDGGALCQRRQFRGNALRQRKGGRVEIPARAEGLERIARRERGKKIARQHRIKGGERRLAVRIGQKAAAVPLLAVGQRKRRGATAEGAEKIIPSGSARFEKGRRGQTGQRRAAGLLPAVFEQGRNRIGSAQQRFCRVQIVYRGGQRGLRCGGRRIGSGRFAGGKAEPADDRTQLEPVEQGVKRTVLAGLGVQLAERLRNGRRAVDFSERPALVGGFAVAQKLFAHTLPDRGIIDPLIDAVEGAELLDEGEGGLFADARDAGDIVRGIAHQRLDLDHLPGGDAVLLPDCRLVDDLGARLAAAGKGETHRYPAADELEAVAVPGGDDAFVPRRATALTQRAEDVIGFVPFKRKNRIAHQGQQLLERLNLLRQFLGHPLAAGLIAVEHLMAEGGGAQVKGKGHRIGGVFLDQLQKDVQKAVNPVGKLAFPGGERLDAVVGAVENGIGIDCEKLH